MAIIELENVTKEYYIGPQISLKQSAANLGRRLIGRESVHRKKFNALSDITFSIEEGEVVGLIGTNGAGKSTLLKHMAYITRPTKGRVSVKGTVAPLIEVGAGLNPELTGRENIFLNASILGLRKKTIREKLDEIIEFSELNEFIDTPIKRYSSGMSVRLGFAIATTVDADILIVDEVLAVGDIAFQRKCFDRMEYLIKRQGKTVLVVSHNIRQIERLCNRVILLDHGKVLADSTPASVCALFFERSDEKIKQYAKTGKHPAGRTTVANEISLKKIGLVDDSGADIEKIPMHSDWTIRVRFQVLATVTEPSFTIGVHTTDLLYLTTYNSDKIYLAEELAPGEYEIEWKVQQMPLVAGVYALRFGVNAGGLGREIFYEENLSHIQVVATGDLSESIAAHREGFFALESQWGSIGAVAAAEA